MDRLDELIRTGESRQPSRPSFARSGGSADSVVSMNSIIALPSGEEEARHTVITQHSRQPVSSIKGEMLRLARSKQPPNGTYLKLRRAPSDPSKPLRSIELETAGDRDTLSTTIMHKCNRAGGRIAARAGLRPGDLGSYDLHSVRMYRRRSSNTATGSLKDPQAGLLFKAFKTSSDKLADDAPGLACQLLGGVPFQGKMLADQGSSKTFQEEAVPADVQVNEAYTVNKPLPDTAVGMQVIRPLDGRAHIRGTERYKEYVWINKDDGEALRVKSRAIYLDRQSYGNRVRVRV